MTFQRVLKSAGFNKTEIAALYGVSRQTIHTWSTGEAPRPGSYTARMQCSITQALCVALDKRILPLAPMERQARAERIAKMARTLQSLKPAPIQETVTR